MEPTKNILDYVTKADFEAWAKPLTDDEGFDGVMYIVDQRGKVTIHCDAYYPDGETDTDLLSSYVEAIEISPAELTELMLSGWAVYDSPEAGMEVEERYLIHDRIRESMGLISVCHNILKN